MIKCSFQFNFHHNDLDSLKYLEIQHPDVKTNRLKYNFTYVGQWSIIQYRSERWYEQITINILYCPFWPTNYRIRKPTSDLKSARSIYFTNNKNIIFFLLKHYFAKSINLLYWSMLSPFWSILYDWPLANISEVIHQSLRLDIRMLNF